MRLARLFGIALLAAVMTWLGLGSSGADDPARASAEQVSRSFTLTADPTVAVLQVVFEGDMSGIDAHYQVFGDGRFLVQRVDTDGSVIEEAATQLSFEELTGLVRTVVDHGIVDVTPSQLAERIVAKTGRPLIEVVDAGQMMLTLELADYVVNCRSRGPLTHRFLLGSPKAVHRSAPAEPEPEGLVELTEELYTIRQRSAGPVGGAQR